MYAARLGPLGSLLVLVACQGDGASDTVPDVRINELMASNQAAVPDPGGEYPDWIELVNLDDVEVDLTGATLTDDLAQPARWTFPDTTLGVGAYLVVWADDGGANDLSATFKLSASGEAVGLFGPDGAAWDTVEFGPQETDVAWARTPDGGDTWAAAAPSPGATNP